ncbi:Anhydro-N-acetylmuramic acid kinase [Roseibacterium elongatum DSM 19469]|uniref:Anhydro-N-acetylmuramic acid kinase n=1 Tax=Roseicyclus elongatus DSM 19469 TaxID=1294273 RepID=W8RUG8_9RHOB|nr:Anhydro-N-acetylmuramic acid kinase [Roseibacterium elongatum DSM 19469]
MKEKGQRWRMAGAMSGTSLDGVDLAVIETDGQRIVAFGETRYRPYDARERAVLRDALGTWPGDDRAKAAARVVEAAHLEALDGLEPVEALGFHGQTLAHDPEGARTHQAGDGARLAQASGRQVIWDFRSTDMQLGGQGAPLAPFFHWACARWIGAAGPVAFLNLGGVGNITWVDPRTDGPEVPGACVAFDTGPANAPIDDFMAARGLGARDEGGALALHGRPDRDVVRAVLGERFFARMPPKSLDRDDFAGLVDCLDGLSDADGAATLAAVAVAAVGAGMQHLPARPARVLVTGGGRHNAAVMGGRGRDAALRGRPGRGRGAGWRFSRGAGLCLSRGAGDAGPAHQRAGHDRSGGAGGRWAALAALRAIRQKERLTPRWSCLACGPCGPRLRLWGLCPQAPGIFWG